MQIRKVANISIPLTSMSASGSNFEWFSLWKQQFLTIEISDFRSFTSEDSANNSISSFNNCFWISMLCIGVDWLRFTKYKANSKLCSEDCSCGTKFGRKFFKFKTISESWWLMFASRDRFLEKVSINPWIEKFNYLHQDSNVNILRFSLKDCLI